MRYLHVLYYRHYRVEVFVSMSESMLHRLLSLVYSYELWYQFTCKLSRLDGEHVVFGRVVQGMDIVYVIEGGAGTYSGKPRKKVVIADSGEIPKNHWDEENWTSSFWWPTTSTCLDSRHGWFVFDLDSLVLKPWFTNYWKYTETRFLLYVTM